MNPSPTGGSRFSESITFTADGLDDILAQVRALRGETDGLYSSQLRLGGQLAQTFRPLGFGPGPAAGPAGGLPTSVRVRMQSQAAAGGFAAGGYGFGSGGSGPNPVFEQQAAERRQQAQLRLLEKADRSRTALAPAVAAIGNGGRPPGFGPGPGGPPGFGPSPAVFAAARAGSAAEVEVRFGGAGGPGEKPADARARTLSIVERAKAVTKWGRRVRKTAGEYTKLARAITLADVKAAPGRAWAGAKGVAGRFVNATWEDADRRWRRLASVTDHPFARAGGHAALGLGVGVTAMAVRGMTGTVEMNRFQNAQGRVERELGHAFKPAIDTATDWADRGADWLGRRSNREKDLIMYGGLGATGYAGLRAVGAAGPVHAAGRWAAGGALAGVARVGGYVAGGVGAKGLGIAAAPLAVAGAAFKSRWNAEASMEEDQRRSRGQYTDEEKVRFHDRTKLPAVVPYHVCSGAAGDRSRTRPQRPCEGPLWWWNCGSACRDA